MSYLISQITEQHPHCVVVGGGVAAAESAKKWINAGAQVTVIAPEINHELKVQLINGNLMWQIDTFSAEAMTHVDPPSQVVAACDCLNLNAAVVRYCQHHQILVELVE
jgi:siroheme synthase-like protein